MRYRACIKYYAAGAAALFLLKCHYRLAGCEELLWLLAPAAGWAGLLSGCPFTYLPGEGYASRSLRLLIAPSCSGLQFLLIAGAMLLFTFIHRMGTEKKRALWAAGSLSAAYGYTIFINGIRIVLSVRLPQTGLLTGVLNPERLHTLIGAAVYFASLLLLYQIAEALSRRLAEEEECGVTAGNECLRSLSPLFWYGFLVLLIPALSRLWLPDRRDFLEYAFLVSAVCLILLLGRKILRVLSIFLLRIWGRMHTIEVCKAYAAADSGFLTEPPEGCAEKGDRYAKDTGSRRFGVKP